MDKIIELLKYIILSVVQGVGEVLPISSSGHLILVRKLIGVGDGNVSIELVLHLASLIALFVYYRRTIFSLITGFFKYVFYKNIDYKKDFKFVMGMIVSLVPACLVGYFLDDYFDYLLNYSFIIGLFLVINGVNLFCLKRSENNKNIEDLSILSFFKIGVGQCFGLVPGISRSGSTLSMCYREKLNKEDSQKFTFLMLFPLVLGSIFLKIEDFVFSKYEIILLLISFILTLFITLFSIKILNKIINNNKIHYFSYYCVVVGILVMFIS